MREITRMVSATLIWLLIVHLSLFGQNPIDELRIGNTQKPESEIHAAIDPADSSRMMVAVMRRDPILNGNSLSFSFYSTSDFGRNWFLSPFRGTTANNSAVAGGGDPVIVYDSGGRVHLVWLLLTFNSLTGTGEIGLHYANTDDQGITWEQPPAPAVVGELKLQEGTTDIVATDRYLDKPWLAIDQTDGAFRDNLYMSYYQLDVSGDTIASIRCARKRRTAVNFSSQSTQVNTNNYRDIHFANVEVDTKGVIHIIFWATLDGAHYALYHTQSTDGATSFREEIKITDLSFPKPLNATTFPSPIEGVERIYPSLHLGIDHSSGIYRDRLYAVWMAQGTGEDATTGFDVFFAHSSDGGLQWSTPVIVNDDKDPAIHQFNPVIEVSPTGVVILSWYDQRVDPANAQTHYYLAYSTDGGRSFEHQFPVSTQPSDFSKIGTANSGFGVGEYTQVISTHQYALPFWADGRLNNGEVKVFTSKVSLEDAQITSIDGWQQLGSELVLTEIYPNPTKNWIYVEWELKTPAKVQLTMVDLNGREIWNHFVRSKDIGQYRQKIDLSDFSNGTYYVVLKGEKGQTTARKIIVNH